jgi:hypothetical protein
MIAPWLWRLAGFCCFGGGGTPAPPPPPAAPPSKSDAEIQQAAADAAARLRLRKGRQATYLTQGPGVTGDLGIAGTPAVTRPTLLGGGNA